LLLDGIKGANAPAIEVVHPLKNVKQLSQTGGQVIKELLA